MEYSSPRQEQKAVRCFLVLAFVLFSSAAGAAESDCKQTTLRQALAENRHDMFQSTLGAAGSGLLLYAERNGKTAVLAGSFLLFAKEFSDFLQANSGRQQLGRFNGLDPDTRVQACIETGNLASLLNFQKLTVIQPLHEAAPGLLIRRNLLDQIGKIPSASLAPRTPVTLALPDTGTAAAIRMPVSSASFSGRVVDGSSGRPLSFAYVTLVGISTAQSLTPSAFTQDDGSFRFDYIPVGQYVLAVNSAGYSGSSTFVQVPGSIQMNLRHSPKYPCRFTVFNRTGWRISVGAGGAGSQPMFIAPYQSETATLNRADQFFARAEFSDRSPITWGPIAAECSGPGYINISP